MSQDTLDRTIAVVAKILNEKRREVAVCVDIGSSMETVAEWDSLNFINIFLTINEEFGIAPDMDDAMSYRSIASIVDFVDAELLGQPL